MPAFSTAFHAVYHVTTINHWQTILDEQLAVLLRNRNLKSVTFTVATTSAKDFAVVTDRLTRAVVTRSPRIPIEGRISDPNEFEHRAMIAVDRLAGADDVPILYFHMKGVSHSPPTRLWEVWRTHLNQLVSDADRWADFLVQARFDACGPFLTFDAGHGFSFFAGNFWMANASYVRKLPAYQDFIRDPGTPHFLPFSRYLAEIAVNRARRMNAFAIDGTFLTPQSVFQRLGTLADAAPSSVSFSSCDPLLAAPSYRDTTG